MRIKLHLLDLLVSSLLVSFLVINLGFVVLLVRSDLGLAICLVVIGVIGIIRFLVRSDLLLYYYLVV